MRCWSLFKKDGAALHTDVTRATCPRAPREMFKGLLIDVARDVPRVEFLTCGSVPPARYVLRDSVAAAEGYSEQQKQGCEFYN